jgi:uncharacterized membrane protein
VGLGKIRPMSRPLSMDFVHAAIRWFGRHPDQLAPGELKALEHATQRLAMSADPAPTLGPQTLGERVADSVARLGGSWTFIALCLASLFAWTIINTRILGASAFDPYPFIFLNLLLSMVAALQAPVIMMSQNRQAAIDRQLAAHDYEVNLKAEIEIMALHEKMDALRSGQLAAMLEKQQQQIDLLAKLLARPDIAART